MKTVGGFIIQTTHLSQRKTTQVTQLPQTYTARLVLRVGCYTPVYFLNADAYLSMSRWCAMRWILCIYRVPATDCYLSCVYLRQCPVQFTCLLFNHWSSLLPPVHSTGSSSCVLCARFLRALQRPATDEWWPRGTKPFRQNINSPGNITLAVLKTSQRDNLWYLLLHGFEVSCKLK